MLEVGTQIILSLTILSLVYIGIKQDARIKELEVSIVATLELATRICKICPNCEVIEITDSGEKIINTKIKGEKNA